MSGERPSLAIIVVNFGSTDLLRANLAAVAAEVVPDAVVVVDNLSTSDERERVRALSAAQGWHLVELPVNAGFGAGMNAGIERARALGTDIWLLLNPDATIDGPSVTRLTNAVTASPGVVVSPRVVDSAGRTFFAGADVYLRDGRIAGAARRAGSSAGQRWEWLSGACLMVSASAWDAAGGFDDEYFLYWEDVDFSRRVVESGGGVAVIEDAIAVHDEGGTHREAKVARGKSTIYYYFNIRNRLVFAAKHLGEDGFARWSRSAWRSAWATLLQGGRRQFLRPVRPLGAAVRGVRDGRRLGREILGRGRAQ